jgi:hypothetical protein
VNGSNGGGVHKQALLHVRPLKHAEPYALVRKDVMSKLKKAHPYTWTLDPEPWTLNPEL